MDPIKKRDEPRCWQDVEVNSWCTITCLNHFCLIYVFKQAFWIPSISLNLNRNIPTTQLVCVMPWNTYREITVRVVWEQTFLIKKMIYISILWIFHVFQLHLHIDSQMKGCSSISVASGWFSGLISKLTGGYWTKGFLFVVKCRSSTVYSHYYLHKLAMCHECILMWSFYIDCRSVLFFLSQRVTMCEY